MHCDWLGWPECFGIDSYAILKKSRQAKAVKAGEGGGGGLGRGCFVPGSTTTNTPPAFRPTHNVDVRHVSAEQNHWGCRSSAQIPLRFAAVGDVEGHFDFW